MKTSSALIVEQALPNVTGAGRILQDVCHHAAVAGGWHKNLATGEDLTPIEQESRFPMRLMLAVSELAEAMEGHRKNLPDDKLKNRRMAEVELADTVIRVFDLAGAMGYDLGAAIQEKIAFNLQREDHKFELRQAGGAGVKAY